jgi:hypothetical protein
VKLTARALNRATLARQLLLRRQRLGVVDAVDRVVALQAQEPASPHLALWNRVAGFDPDELHEAFADQRIVKSQLMRITLHAVTAADYPAFHEAMQVTLRAARLNDRRFRSEGVSVEDTEALVPDLLEFAATPRTNAEVEGWLEKRFGSPKPRIWWALRQYGPFVHAGTGGPWTFAARPAYVGARERARPGDAAASMRHLVRRYLGGFGPATMQDVAQFSTISRAPVREAISSLGDELEQHEGPNGEALVDVTGGLRPAEDSPAPPRLLGMWDSTLLAYADRSRIIPGEHRTAVMRKNGDVLPTLLVDGLVAGVWRAVEGAIEATAFDRLPDEAWEGLDAEARALRRFLADREPRLYGRYAHWWSELPKGEVRVLGH